MALSYRLHDVSTAQSGADEHATAELALPDCDSFEVAPPHRRRGELIRPLDMASSLFMEILLRLCFGS
jgi:hypothetical protein